MIKFLQSLALDFLHFCLQFFPGNFSQLQKNFHKLKYRKFQKVVLAQVTPSIVISLESLGVKF